MDDVARQDDDREPARHLVHEASAMNADMRRSLSAAGSRIGAERRLGVREARDRAVERVGDARRDEDAERLA